MAGPGRERKRERADDGGMQELMHLSYLQWACMSITVPVILYDAAW